MPLDTIPYDDFLEILRASRGLKWKDRTAFISRRVDELKVSLRNKRGDGDDNNLVTSWPSSLVDTAAQVSEEASAEASQTQPAAPTPEAAEQRSTSPSVTSVSSTDDIHDDPQDNPSPASTQTVPQTSTGDDIPVEQLQAIKWGLDECPNTEAPEAKIWLVQTKAETQSGTNARIWTMPDSEAKAELMSVYASTLNQDRHADSLWQMGSKFKFGRPMKKLSVTVSTCVGPQRPAKLYRAIHDAMPFDGIAARGFEILNTDGLFFQYHMQNHFVWQCRQPSPFISTSARMFGPSGAVSFAAAFKARGRTGIKILEIETKGKNWDHHISRLWDVRHVCDTFGISWEAYHSSEYLVESFIPKQHITHVWELETDEQWEKLDPGAYQRKHHEALQETFDRLKADRKRKREEGVEIKKKQKREKGVPWTRDFKATISQARKKRS